MYLSEGDADVSQNAQKKKVTCGKTVQTLTPDQDKQKRTKCTQQAVALSLQWRPVLAWERALIKISDVWIARQIRLVTKYKPRVVFAALACWKAWVSCVQSSADPFGQSSEEWGEFIE